MQHVGLHAILLVLLGIAAAAVHRADAALPQRVWLDSTAFLARVTEEFPQQAESREARKDCDKLTGLDWVRQYAAWHAEERQKPDAKFVMYICGFANFPPNSPNTTIGVYNCNGLGDRMRGMVEMVRLAKYANRVLLFWWSKPFPLENALEPNSDIDWRVRPEYNLAVSDSTPLLHWDLHQPAPEGLRDGSWREMYADQRLVIMNIKYQDCSARYFPYMPHLGRTDSAERACATQMLYRPSPKVAGMVAEQREKMFGDAQAPYIAIHLRLGGMGAEKKNLQRFPNVKGVFGSMLCARALAAAYNMTGTPVLMLTDNAVLWRMLAAGYFRGVTGPTDESHLPVHSDALATKTGVIPESHHYASYVDLGLLAQATCLIRSPSGFSDQAWRLGKQRCSVLVNDCVDFLNKVTSSADTNEV